MTSCSPAATRARDVTPLRLARVSRTEHAGRGSSFPLTGPGSRGGPRGVWSPRSAPLPRRVNGRRGRRAMSHRVNRTPTVAHHVHPPGSPCGGSVDQLPQIRSHQHRRARPVRHHREQHEHSPPSAARSTSKLTTPACPSLRAPGCADRVRQVRGQPPRRQDRQRARPAVDGYTSIPTNGGPRQWMPSRTLDPAGRLPGHRPRSIGVCRQPGSGAVRAASARLRRLVPFDSAGWTATGLATLLRPPVPGSATSVDVE